MYVLYAHPAKSERMGVTGWLMAPSSARYLCCADWRSAMTKHIAGYFMSMAARHSDAHGTVSTKNDRSYST